MSDFEIETVLRTSDVTGMLDDLEQVLAAVREGVAGISRTPETMRVVQKMEATAAQLRGQLRLEKPDESHERS